MNAEPGPLSFRRYGCIVALAIIVLLIIGAVLFLRHLVIGTAVPFKAVANLIEKTNPNVKFTDIGGNLSTGPSVGSITWGDDPANRSEILDLRVKYNGYADVSANKRIVISDVGVRKAHIDLADFGTITHTKSVTGTTGGSSSPSGSGSSSSPADDFGMESFEIQKVLIEDVLITNRNSAFRLSIPKVSWTGFKATKDKVEAGELIVDSDRLQLRTGPGRTLPMGVESVTFQKSLAGTMQPLLHASVLQPISFLVDYTFVPEVKMPAYHLTVADGKVEMSTTADGGQVLHVAHLDLASFLDARKLYGPEAADFPSDLTLEATVAPEGGPLKIASGGFRLGVATFQIEPQEIMADDADKGTLHAVANIGAVKIRWALPIKDWPVECRPTFSSEPELPTNEILARVFAGKKVEELSEEERAVVADRMRAYFRSNLPER